MQAEACRQTGHAEKLTCVTNSQSTHQVRSASYSSDGAKHFLVAESPVVAAIDGSCSCTSVNLAASAPSRSTVCCEQACFKTGQCYRVKSALNTACQLFCGLSHCQASPACQGRFPQGHFGMALRLVSQVCAFLLHADCRWLCASIGGSTQLGSRCIYPAAAQLPPAQQYQAAAARRRRQHQLKHHKQKQQQPLMQA